MKGKQRKDREAEIKEQKRKKGAVAILKDRQNKNREVMTEECVERR